MKDGKAKYRIRNREEKDTEIKKNRSVAITGRRITEGGREGETKRKINREEKTDFRSKNRKKKIRKKKVCSNNF